MVMVFRVFAVFMGCWGMFSGLYGLVAPYDWAGDNLFRVSVGSMLLIELADHSFSNWRK